MDLNKKLQSTLEERFLQGPVEYYDALYFDEIQELLSKWFQIDAIIQRYEKRFQQSVVMLWIRYKVKNVVDISLCYPYLDHQSKQFLNHLLVAYYFQIQEYISTQQYFEAINSINLVLKKYLLHKYQENNTLESSEPIEIQLWNNYKISLLRFLKKSANYKKLAQTLIDEQYFQRLTYLQSLRLEDGEIQDDIYVKYYKELRK